MEFANTQMFGQKLGVWRKQLDEHKLGVWLKQYPPPSPEPQHLPSQKGSDRFGSFSHKQFHCKQLD